MTREEAIDHIKDVICENNTIKPNMVVFEQEKQALCMAIKALEQEPCEDAVSRQAVHVLLHELEEALVYEKNYISRERDTTTIIEDILDLPPVTPKPLDDVLDKIRAEIEQLTITEGGDDYVRKMAELFSLKMKVLQIIDKYRGNRNEQARIC